MRLSPVTRLDHCGGAEGPTYDPYHYEEMTFSRGDMEVTLHDGLDEYIKLNGHIFEPPPFVDRRCEKCFHKWMAWQWEKFTGISIARAHRFLHEKQFPLKCKKCGSRKFKWVNGYPGETFQVCSKCDNICASQFDRSAIE